MCMELLCLEDSRHLFLQAARCQLYSEQAMRKQSLTLAGFLLGILATIYCTHLVKLRAQQTERPGNSKDHPIDVPRDLTGLSIKNPRVRMVHTVDPAREGGSMYLQQ